MEIAVPQLSLSADVMQWCTFYIVHLIRQFQWAYFGRGVEGEERREAEESGGYERETLIKSINIIWISTNL